MAQRVDRLEPRILWRRFAQLAEIPRCSKKEAAAMAWIESVAADHGCKCNRDRVGNRLISVPATSGLEGAPTVILQAHVDMVCEKTSDSRHDFERDPLRLCIRGDRVSAENTTLGADNGIGVAAALAFLDDRDAAHGPLELLFTVDEETGLTGARQIEAGFFSGDFLLNLDAEILGRFTVGSAGGQDTHITFPAPREPAADEGGLRYYRVVIDGLRGGHSGGDIDKNRGNSIKILGRLLVAAAEDEAVGELRLGAAWGGSKRNAIPREAQAVIAVPGAAASAFEEIMGRVARQVRAQLEATDSGLRVETAELSGEARAKAERAGLCSPADTMRFLHLLTALPSGIVAMSTELEGLVDTSTNIGVLVDLGDAYQLTSATRSATSASLAAVVSQLRAAAKLAGADVSHSDGYPPWEPTLDTPLLRIVDRVYRRLFDDEPTFEAIHGGLECGLLLAARPELQVVAYGAEIHDAHSPGEWVSISSVQRFWAFTRSLVEELARCGA